MSDSTLFWVAVICIVAGLFGLVANERKWEAFKAKHHCKIVGKASGDVFNTVGIGANGQVTVGIGSTPDKTGWQCDDGMTYWR